MYLVREMRCVLVSIRRIQRSFSFLFKLSVFHECVFIYYLVLALNCVFFAKITAILKNIQK